MTRYTYTTPNGTTLIGSSDTVPCCGNINSFDENGEPEWEGYTDIYWDGQTTKTRNQEPLYLDENGDEWTLRECTREEAGE